MDFGNYGIVIANPNRFFQSIFKQLTEKNISFEYGVINYHDFSSKDEFSIDFFDKSDEFKHQQEYRIVIHLKDNNPFNLKIGSIREYATMIGSKQIIESKFELKTMD